MPSSTRSYRVFAVIAAKEVNALAGGIWSAELDNVTEATLSVCCYSLNFKAERRHLVYIGLGFLFTCVASIYLIAFLESSQSSESQCLYHENLLNGRGGANWCSGSVQHNDAQLSSSVMSQVSLDSASRLLIQVVACSCFLVLILLLSVISLILDTYELLLYRSLTA